MVNNINNLGVACKKNNTLETKVLSYKIWELCEKEARVWDQRSVMPLKKKTKRNEKQNRNIQDYLPQRAAVPF